jgi:hypothetical protein
MKTLSRYVVIPKGSVYVDVMNAYLESPVRALPDRVVAYLIHFGEYLWLLHKRNFLKKCAYIFYDSF